MNCPICTEKMKEIEKCNITLDICPGCKGVWLDRGELEKLMEYAVATGGETAAQQENTPGTRRDLNSGERRECRDGYKNRDFDDDDDHDEDRSERYRGAAGPQGQYPRKKSWVSNVFDMFGD